MTTAVFDTLKASRNLKAAGVAEAQADAIVATVAEAFEDTVATKTDVVAIRADIDKLESSSKADLKAEIAGIRTTIAKLETSMWRIGIAIASVAVLLNKALDWLIR